MSGSVGQYTQSWFPWVATTRETGTYARSNNSSLLGMGFGQVPNAQNNEAAWDRWVDSVTWKIAYIHRTESDAGICTFLFGETSLGTVDQYSASIANNVYAEITGISVMVAEVKDFTTRAATKNASSTGYKLEQQSLALIRTGGTPSTPGGTDTPGYTFEWIFFMGEKAVSTATARGQNSTFLGGSLCHNGAVVNNYRETDAWVDVGTFKIAVVSRKGTTQGIASFKLTGIVMATQDWYNGSSLDNQYTETTGVIVTVAQTWTLRVQADTKNASATDYYTEASSLKLLRTGA